MFKKLAKAILALVLLLVLAVVGMIFFINTDQYKSALEGALLASLGYELNIAGDLSFNVFPSIGLTLNDVRLRNPAYPQELASTSAISLRVDPVLLLRGQLHIQELVAEDFHINWFSDAQGRNIWQVEPDMARSVAGAATSNSSSTNAANANRASAIVDESSADDIVSVSFERISISNASIDIQDLARGLRYSIGSLNLDSRNSNIEGRPFLLDLSFDLLTFDADSGLTMPTALGLRSNVIADLNNGKVRFDDLYFNLTPLLLQGQLEIENLNDKPTVTGNLFSNDFDPLGLMETLRLRDGTDEFDANNLLSGSPLLAFAFNLSADENHIVVPKFTATLGCTELEADLSVLFATDFSPTNIRYKVLSNGIDITPFLPPSPPPVESEDASELSSNETVTDIATGSATAAASEDTELPIDLLRTMNVSGTIFVESVTANEMLFNDINIFTTVEDGVLDIEVQPVSIFQGTVQGNMRVDGRSNDADLTARFNVDKINIIDLAPSISQLNSITGKLDIEANFTASASSRNSLRDTLSGLSSFAITENSVDIGVIKQVFTAIAALSPTGEEIQQWPDVLQFSELTGSLLFQNGIAADQLLALRMDNFDVSGGGGIDLQTETFDYDLEFTVLGEPAPQTIPINELYHDVRWPVQCAANIADPVSQYCRPDFSKAREIFTQIGTNAVRSRLNEAIIDRVPDELQDAARGLLRNIFN